MLFDIIHIANPVVLHAFRFNTHSKPNVQHAFRFNTHSEHGVLNAFRFNTSWKPRRIRSFSI